MDPLSIMALGAGIGAVGNVVSALMASGNADKANALIQEAVAKYGPEAEGILNDYAKQSLATSSLRAENEAPEAVSAQREALRRMQQVAENGYTPEEQASLNRIQQQSAAQAAQQQAALKSQMARRGVAGTGQELAMNLANQGQQTAAQYQAGLDVAANAQRRAFQAMQGLGSLGTNVRQQAYGEAERRAEDENQKQRDVFNGRMNVAGNKLNAASNAANAQGQYGQVAPSMLSSGATSLSTGLISWGARKDGK